MQCFIATSSLLWCSDHLEVRLSFQDRAQPLTHNRMVISQQDTNHLFPLPFSPFDLPDCEAGDVRASRARRAGASNGIQAATHVPAPGSLEMQSVPPSNFTRSLMPV